MRNADPPNSIAMHSIYPLGYISNFHNLTDGSFLLVSTIPEEGYYSMWWLISRSVPQLRHEPIAYWFSLPQFGQFSTIEVVMLSYRCSSIKNSVWLYTLRNNQLFCDSDSLCLGSTFLWTFSMIAVEYSYSCFNIYMFISNRIWSEGKDFAVLLDNKFCYAEINSILGYRLWVGVTNCSTS